MKFYLIKVKETNTVIKYSGSLKAFMEDRGMECDDGHRRAMSHTRERDSYYKGYKVLFYGIDPQEEIYDSSTVNRIEKVVDEIKLEEIGKDYEEMYNAFKPNLNRKVDEYPYIGKNDFKIEIEKENTKRNVLVIGDLHFPFEHKNAFEFAKKVHKENDITDVVFIGDVVDNHYSSFHDQSPDGHGGGKELDLVEEKIDEWKAFFPEAMLTLGNHDILPSRKAFKGGLSKRWVKSLNEMFKFSWDCKDFHKIGNFLFTHGVGLSAKGRAIETGNSVVQGHLHSKFSCEAISNGNSNCTYAIQTGCLIDRDAYAFAYGKFGRNPALGLVVIEDIEGDPTVKMISMPMELKR